MVTTLTPDNLMPRQSPDAFAAVEAWLDSVADGTCTMARRAACISRHDLSNTRVPRPLGNVRLKERREIICARRQPPCPAPNLMVLQHHQFEQDLAALDDVDFLMPSPFLWAAWGRRPE